MSRFFAPLALVLLCALTMPVLSAQPAHAVQPDEVLADPTLEARAREISKDVRCLVCQNQSIDDSNADLARDLRIVVRERLLAGDSNQEVRAYLVARYGEYVLLTPPLSMATILLWAAPALLLLGGGLAIFFWFRGRRRDAMAGPNGADGGDAPALNADERDRIQHLLAEDQQSSGGDRS
jgi:cytochrome c-type biogenesis protein CcmH